MSAKPMANRTPAPANIASKTLLDIALHPSLWRFLLFAGSPFRLALAANVFVGRSMRSILLDIVRKLIDLLGWLAAPLRIKRLRNFERSFFPLHRWHAVVAAAAAARAVVFLGSRLADRASGRSARRRALRRALITCEDPAEWRQMTAELQTLSDRGLSPHGQAAFEASLYDRRLLQERTHHLRRVRERGDASELMFALRADLIRNLGGMASAALHQRLLAVPTSIETYIKEVCAGLKAIAAAPSVPLDERLAFLRETRHAFGRTALVLSGGGSFGAFHLGVLKALLEHNLLPRVLSGSSAGAIVAALVCTRTDEELVSLFSTLSEQISQLEIDFYSSNTTLQIVRHFYKKGVAQDHNVLQERLQRLLGDVTFAEAHARSGRVLNVSVCAADTAEPPRLLNYLTAPDVLVWSAVAASSAFPLLFAPQDMVARDPRGHIVPFANQNAASETQRRWRDGSLEEDLPMRGLSEMFSVNYFLVSQANPYLLPIISLKEALPRTLGTLAEAEFKHRCKQIMELLPQRVGASRFLKLLSQPWDGDVTVVMPVNSMSALKAIVNLSKDDLLRAVREGQRCTWAKLPSIAANCQIEVTLDECLIQVTDAFRRARAWGRGRKSSSSTANLDGISPASNAATTFTTGGLSSPSSTSHARTHSQGNGIASSTGTGITGSVGTGMRRGIPSWMHLQSLGIPAAGSHEALGALMDTSNTSIQLQPQQSQGLQTAFDMQGVHHSVPDLTATAVLEGDEEEDDGGAEQINNIGTAVETSPAIDNAEQQPKRNAMHVSSSLPCMDDVWLELFRLAPAASVASPSGGGQSLDFIAP